MFIINDNIHVRSGFNSVVPSICHRGPAVKKKHCTKVPYSAFFYPMQKNKGKPNPPIPSPN